MVWTGNSIRPSVQLDHALSGKTPWEKVSEPIKSMARLQFFKAAEEVLAATTPKSRRQRLDSLPEHVKVHVEYEIKRILKYERERIQRGAASTTSG